MIADELMDDPKKTIIGSEGSGVDEEDGRSAAYEMENTEDNERYASLM